MKMIVRPCMVDLLGRVQWLDPYVPPRNKRLDPEAYERAGTVFFITIRARNSMSPFVHHNINEIIIDILHAGAQSCGCVVFTYCLMPDHIHYLTTPGTDGRSVLTFVNQFKGKTTNGSWKVGWSGRLWQPRYYDHAVRSAESLRQIADYILQNPVRRGLVSRQEDWAWGGELNPLPIQ